MLTITISNEFVTGSNIKSKYYDIAECEGIKVRKAKAGTIHDLARKLQEAGHDPDIMVEVVRDGVRVFTPCELRKWADTMLYETDRGFRRVKWDYEAAEQLAERRRNAA